MQIQNEVRVFSAIKQNNMKHSEKRAFLLKERQQSVKDILNIS